MSQRDTTMRGVPPPPPVTGYARALADAGTAPAAAAPPPKPQATETLARRAGALVNEIDFPAFVAGLVHGTFDAVVDASIRQMETFSDMVAAAAKPIDQFTAENVTLNQARDWLAQRFPGDVALSIPAQADEESRLLPRAEGLAPAWLAEFGLEGEELTAELLEERVLPQVRNRVGNERHQLLATMVMLGMNRVAVRDGTISAKVKFRAEARDAATVQYATSSDPPAVGKWGERGSSTYAGSATTKVSTLDVNAQNETAVRAELYGEVKLNFVSETLPLDRLVDAVKISMVQRNSAVRATAPAAQNAAPAPATAPAVAGG